MTKLIQAYLTYPRSFYSDCRAQAIPIAAVAFGVLLAFMGMVFDGGRLYYEKRRLQLAADAGAIGGANEIFRANPSSLIISAAKADAKMNGFDDTDNNIDVEVETPPITGPRAGDNRFVEVTVRQQFPTTFLRVLGVNDYTVAARAVAGLVRYAENCVIALDPTQSGALTVGGTSLLNASCGIAVNSTNNQAIVANGGGCINGTSVQVSGAWVANGSSNCINPAPYTDQPPVIDPLSYMTNYTPSSLGLPTFTNTLVATGVRVLAPGYYKSTVGTAAIKIVGGNVTFLPGMYILDSGMEISGSPIVTGNGVTFYSTSSTGTWKDFDIAGTATVNFSAPTTGDYEGMLFWNDPASPVLTPGSQIAGTAASRMVGTFYFPSTHVEWAGTSVMSDWTMIVANTIRVTGVGNVNGGFMASDIKPASVKPTLVE